MAIYTKSGDKGETGLIGGRRVSKSNLRIATIGEVDELNATLGILRTLKPSPKTNKILQKIQNDLFAIGAELAAGGSAGRRSRLDRISPRISESYTRLLENHINLLEKKLPQLTNFILPSGTPLATHAHLARAVCRRAERSVVALGEKETASPQLIVYLNRLSDLLFMLAREDLYDKKIPEIPWKAT